MVDQPLAGQAAWLHSALIGLHELERVPSPAIATIAFALACAVGGLWVAVTRVLASSWIAGGVYLLAVAADWAWLGALPRRNVSFGPVKPPLIGLLGLRLALSLVPLVGYTAGSSVQACVVIEILGQLSASGAIVYATRLEPFRLDVTHLELATPKLAAGKRVRLIQISDLHVERVTCRERELVERVNALDADYILLTGDYLNFSFVGEPRAIADARRVLGALRAKRGIYAVRGTQQVDPNALLPVLFDGLPIRWLQSEHRTVSHDGYRMTFAGASCERRPDLDAPAVERALAGMPEDAYTVLLYHTPERVAEAAAGGVDLYLSGHTHGGQIRLPLYGALITATDVGKRYEMGRYDLKDLTLYVSRGVGMEGMAAPRVRFLCPPEVVCIDVRGCAPPP